MEGEVGWYDERLFYCFGSGLMWSDLCFYFSNFFVIKNIHMLIACQPGAI